MISKVLGRDVKFVELTREEIIAQWREQGFSDEDIEFFVLMRTHPPQAGHTVLPTIEQVTGRPAATPSGCERTPPHSAGEGLGYLPVLIQA